MTRKEVSELRRRFTIDRTAITHFYGCYVNSRREIISYIDESLGLMPEDEATQYLSLLKKSLSGKLGKNLIDIVFSTQQVMDGKEHRNLMALRDSELRDMDTRNAFFQKVIASLDMGQSNYLILLAYDAYDVPYRGTDGVKRADEADQLYRAIICAICPVKDGKLSLGYYAGDNEFHNCLANQIVGAPELGFLFPAFDDRTANIYNALFYTRKPEEMHHELIDGLFHVEPPMSAAEQRETFQAILTDAGLARMDLIRAVHEQLKAKADAAQESHTDEPLTVSADDIASIFADCGVGEEDRNTFLRLYEERFGAGTVLPPENLVDNTRFDLQAGNVLVRVSPEYSGMLEKTVVDGRTYIMIPTAPEVEVNGFTVQV